MEKVREICSVVRLSVVVCWYSAEVVPAKKRMIIKPSVLIIICSFI